MAATRRVVGVSGASGFLGAAVVRGLDAAGFEPVPLVRDRARPGVFWDPAAGVVDAASLEGAHAVVHLAGESVASGRWNDARKARIRDSRVEGTALVARALAALTRKPKVMVSASGIGWYGDRGDDLLDENSAPGHDFLADVCCDWEAACAPARDAGIRVVNVRLGVVLGEGGPLAKMLSVFRAGVGGKLAGGQHWMSWVALEDCVRAVLFAIDNAALTGPVNVVSPHPVQNAEFTKVLASAVHRPALAVVPRFALRMVLGEFADYALSSQRVVPARLRDSGFEWRYPELAGALAAVLQP